MRLAHPSHASSSAHHLATYRIAVSPPHAYRRYKQWTAKSPDFAYPKSGRCAVGFQIAYFVYPVRLARGHGYIRRALPPDLRSTFGNPPAGIRYEYQSDPTRDQRCVSGIWSPAHGQGFIAAIRWKLAEKVSDPLARLMVTTLSSIGWRITSRTRVPNSGNSSKNKTPLWANEISPGFGIFPPPTKPAWLIVWCGARKGRCRITASPRGAGLPPNRCVSHPMILRCSSRAGYLAWHAPIMFFQIRASRPSVCYGRKTIRFSMDIHRITRRKIGFLERSGLYYT
jgi:hypothetical protein